MRMRTYVTFAKPWTYTAVGGTFTIPAGRKMKADEITPEGGVVLNHWYGYGQAAVIPKEYFVTTAPTR